jgi:hypothetical protein
MSMFEVPNSPYHDVNPEHFKVELPVIDQKSIGLNANRESSQLENLFKMLEDKGTLL